jgi:hypothetical protein
MVAGQNTKIPLYQSRSSATSTGDARSPDNSAQGNSRQLHCIEGRTWNKWRRPEYNVRFPYSGDPGDKQHIFSKFQHFVELRLKTKGMSFEDKFSRVERINGSSFRLAWRSFSGDKFPKTLLNPKWWSEKSAARWMRAYHGTHLALFSII